MCPITCQPTTQPTEHPSVRSCPVRCNRPIEDIVSHAKAAYEERVRANNPRYVAQSLMTAFTLLELRDAEDHAAFFADKLIEFGASMGQTLPLYEASSSECVAHSELEKAS